MPSRNLELFLIGRDVSASRALRSVQGQAERTSGVMGKLGAVMRTGLLVGAGAAAAAAVASVKMAASFQEATTQLVTGAGESEKALGMVREGLLKTSSQVGVSATDLAHGLYMIESAGFHGARGLHVLKVAAEGARVGAADMATVSDAVTTALNAYHRPASDAAKVTNTLIDTVKAGKVHLQDLASSLGQVLPSAAALRIPFEQVAAAMATMTSQGTSAAKSATSLRFLFSSLVAPTTGAQTALENVGLSAVELGNTLTKKGLPQALALLTDAVGKKFPRGSAAYVAALSKIVGGTRGMQAVLELTGRHAKTFGDNVGNIAHQVDTAGSSVTGWAKVQEDFNFKLDRAKVAIQDLAIKLGTVLLPWVSKAADGLAQFVTGLTSTEQSTNSLTRAGQRFIAFVKDAYGELKGALAPALDRVRSTLRQNQPELRQVGHLLSFLTAHVKLAKIALLPFIENLYVMTKGFDAVITIIGWTIRAFDKAASAAKSTGRAITAAFAAVLGYLRGVPGKIKAVFAGAGRWLYEAGKQIIGGLVDGLKAAALSPVKTAKDIAGKIVDGVKGLFGISSPSKVFRLIGTQIMQGLDIGIRDMSRLPVSRLMSLTDKMIQALKDSKLPKAAKAAGLAVMHGLLHDIGRYQRTTAAISGVKQARNQYASQIAGTVTGEADITQMQGPVGTSNIIDFLTAKKKQDDRFRHDLLRLQHRGLSRRLINQLAAAGPAAAGAYAHALAVQATSGQIRQINRLELGIGHDAQVIGRRVAAMDYNPKLRELRHDLHDIKRELRHDRHEIHIYLDGKEITASVNVHNRRRRNRGGAAAA